MFHIDTYSFNLIVVSWILFAIILLPFLLTITAPYGRHTRSNWGPMIDNKLGWFIMEFPALAIVTFFVISGEAQNNVLIWLFFILFFMHYFNRVMIFPFRIKTSGKRMPLVIALFAVVFNFMNGFIIGYWFGYLSPAYDLDWFYDPRFIVGITLFFTGMSINMRSDNILIRLRKDKSKGYSIPEGGMFKYISCANFFGEIVEWAGFAVMTWCLPTLSFFIWTAVNLVPRALDHHRWYRKTFSDYPSERRALIPFIL